jgi:prepilin-type N-terminal cleavage/methylation domain-containing protein
MKRSISAAGPIAGDRRSAGFTLIEVALVIVITGILITVAMRSATTIAKSGKYEESKQRMIALEYAICGNPTLQNNGTRSDFGYVGDVGAMPLDLSALLTNPGSYTTWKGPYIRGRFQQASTDYMQDAWGAACTYSSSGTITSTGSGTNIVHAFANSAADLLYNRVSGSVTDVDGTPPGLNYCDSVRISLTVPNGVGGTTTRTVRPNPSGYFTMDSVAIGAHDLRIVYTGTHDTISSLSITNAASQSFNQYHFEHALWSTGSGLLEIHGSDSLSGSPACTDVTFWVINSSGSDKTISSMAVTWSSPTAYYGQIYWAGNLVFNKAGSPRGLSGTTYNFSSPQTIASAEKAQVRILDFRSTNNNGGGSPVSMSSVTITVQLSDGTSITEGLPSCP